MKYEEQAKDKEKVKVLRIGYKTVSQTGATKSRKKKELETRREKV